MCGYTHGFEPCVRASSVLNGSKVHCENNSKNGSGTIKYSNFTNSMHIRSCKVYSLARNIPHSLGMEREIAELDAVAPLVGVKLFESIVAKSDKLENRDVLVQGQYYYSAQKARIAWDIPESRVPLKGLMFKIQLSIVATSLPPLYPHPGPSYQFSGC